MSQQYQQETYHAPPPKKAKVIQAHLEAYYPQQQQNKQQHGDQSQTPISLTPPNLTLSTNGNNSNFSANYMSSGIRAADESAQGLLSGRKQKSSTRKRSSSTRGGMSSVYNNNNSALSLGNTPASAQLQPGYRHPSSSLGTPANINIPSSLLALASPAVQQQWMSMSSTGNAFGQFLDSVAAGGGGTNNSSSSPSKQGAAAAKTDYRYQAALAAVTAHAGTAEQRLSAPERRNPALSAMSIRWLKKQAIADQEAREQLAARNALAAKEQASAASKKHQQQQGARADHFTSGPVFMTVTNVPPPDQQQSNISSAVNNTFHRSVTSLTSNESAQMLLNAAIGADAFPTRSEVVPGYSQEAAKAANVTAGDGTLNLISTAVDVSATSPGGPKIINSRYLGGITGAYNAAVRRKLLLSRFAEVVVFLGHEAKERLQSQQDKLEFMLLDGASTRLSAKPTQMTFKMLQELRKQDRKREIKIRRQKEKEEKERRERKKKGNAASSVLEEEDEETKKLRQQQEMKKREGTVVLGNEDADERKTRDPLNSDEDDLLSDDDEDSSHGTAPPTPTSFAAMASRQQQQSRTSVASGGGGASTATGEKPRRAVVSFGVDDGSDQHHQTEETELEKASKNIKDWFDSPITPMMNFFSDKDKKKKRKSREEKELEGTDAIDGVRTARQLQDTLISYLDCLDDDEEEEEEEMMPDEAPAARDDDMVTSDLEDDVDENHNSNNPFEVRTGGNNRRLNSISTLTSGISKVISNSDDSNNNNQLGVNGQRDSSQSSQQSGSSQQQNNKSPSRKVIDKDLQRMLQEQERLIQEDERITREESLGSGSAGSQSFDSRRQSLGQQKFMNANNQQQQEEADGSVPLHRHATSLPNGSFQQRPQSATTTSARQQQQQRPNSSSALQQRRRTSSVVVNDAASINTQNPTSSKIQVPRLNVLRRRSSTTSQNQARRVLSDTTLNTGDEENNTGKNENQNNQNQAPARRFSQEYYAHLQAQPASQLTRAQRKRLFRRMSDVEIDHFNRHRVVEILQAQIAQLQIHVNTLKELRDELRDHRGVLSDRFVSRMMQISQIVAGANWAAVARTTYCTPVDPWSALDGILAPDLLAMLLDTTALIPNSSSISALKQKENNNSSQQRMMSIVSATGTTGSGDQTNSNTNNNIMQQSTMTLPKSLEQSGLSMHRPSIARDESNVNSHADTSEKNSATTTTNNNTETTQTQQQQQGVAKIDFDFELPENKSQVNFKRMLDERMRDCVNFAHQDGLLAELGVFFSSKNATLKRQGDLKPEDANNNNNNANKKDKNQVGTISTLSAEARRLGAIRLERALQGFGGALSSSTSLLGENSSEEAVERVLQEAKERVKFLRPPEMKAVKQRMTDQMISDITNNQDPFGRRESADLSTKQQAATELFFEQLTKYDGTLTGKGSAEAAANLDFTALFDFDGTRGELAAQTAKLTQQQEETTKQSAWTDAPLHDQVALWFAVLKRVAPRICISSLAPGLFDEGSNLYDNPKNQYKLGIHQEDIDSAAKTPDGRLPPFIYFGTTDGDIVGVPSDFVLNPDGEDFHPAKIRAAIIAERKRKEVQRKREEEEKKKRLLEEEQKIYDELVLQRKKQELAKKKKMKQQQGNVPSWLQKEKDRPTSPKSPGKDKNVGLMADGRRASLVEQARKILQERFSSGNLDHTNNNNNNNETTTNSNNNPTNSKQKDDQKEKDSSKSATQQQQQAQKRTASAAAAAVSSATSNNNKKKSGKSKKEKNFDEPEDGNEAFGLTSTKPKRGILAALASAYQNIEKMAKEGTAPTSDPTRRRDTLTELFPKIRIFTGHDGFVVRCLKAARSITLGSVLLSCGEDKVLRISRTYSQELLVVIPGSFAVSSGLHLEFYTDRLMSCHLDGTLRMWDVAVDPPRSQILLSATMQSNSQRIRMEDTGQLFHETFHGQFQRNKYMNPSASSAHMGRGRSNSGSLILGASSNPTSGPQASLRELMKNAPLIAELAASGLRTSIGEPVTKTNLTSSSSASANNLNNNNNSKKSGATNNDGADASMKQFVHRIPVTSLSWATETIPNFRLPTPGKKSQEQVFCVGTALGHIYVCRWCIESSEREDEDDDEDDGDYQQSDKNNQSQSETDDNNKSMEEDQMDENLSATHDDFENNSVSGTSARTGDEDERTEKMSRRSSMYEHVSSRGKRSTNVSSSHTPQTAYLSTTQNNNVNTTTATATVSKAQQQQNVQQQSQQQIATVSIDQLQQRMNDDAARRYKAAGSTTGMPDKAGKQSKQQQPIQTWNSQQQKESEKSTKAAPARLVSTANRLAAANKRMERQRQRERDAATAAVSPVLALMPSPFDSPLVSMVGWNINHLERPVLTKDEQAGAKFGHGLEITAAQKAKMLEAVDASASETMAKLRDAVGAEDRGAAREAQRRKTAGVGGDPQTNGGAPIPGHSCGVSCTLMPGNHFLFSGDDRGVILMWDCRGAFSQDAAIFRRPRKRFQFGHVDAITGLAATSDGLLCSASKDALVVVWSWIDGVKLHSLHHHHHVVTGIFLASKNEPHDITLDPTSNNALAENENDKKDKDQQRDGNNNAANQRPRGLSIASSFGTSLGRDPSMMSVSPGARHHSATSARKRRLSSVASSRSAIRASSGHQIRPWTGGVVVNNNRNNDDPNRRYTKKTLIVTASLDETIQSFEICPKVIVTSQNVPSSNQDGTSNNNNNKNAISRTQSQVSQQQQQMLTMTGRSQSLFSESLVNPTSFALSSARTWN